ncbi:MAG: T9SS type A sorting domain-containing protein [Bacteroidales bacterium]|nr:T9SS type A sorting domain-containing protein [Bacteroidales bacterium]
MKRIIILNILVLLSMNTFPQVKSVELSIDQSGIDTCYTTTENSFGSNVISLAPNPCSGFLTITFSNDENVSNLQIMVLNIQGKVVFDEKMVQQKQFTKTIDISQQPPGIYILKIVEDTKIFSTEIIKN